MARTGRRPGESTAREDILAAARRRFAEEGFRGATIREIAADAEVDPALVHHYFGPKRELFAAVMAFPVSPEVVVDALAEVTLDTAGEELLRTFLGIWDEPEFHDRMRILIRSAISDEASARMLREFVVESILAPLLVRLGADDVRRRASLVASQLVGLAFIRHLIHLEPVASMPADEVVASIAPTIHRYLTCELPPPDA
ncbi:MAG: TetR family transcriptional regulator [Nitriliruptorales bacterium]|nr:TetR family transcriptional regulator [Nitriliruptorales bacterium]